MLADECRKQGIKLFFYHSQLDWHHPDYFPRGGTGRFAGPPDERATGTATWTTWTPSSRSCSRTTARSAASGSTAGGTSPRPTGGSRTTYALIHELQPAALVGNNHHRRRSRARTSRCSRRTCRARTRPASTSSRRSATLPLETCETMNGAWGYNKTDGGYKSTKQLVQLPRAGGGHDANLLLNVGPRPDGTIQPEFVDAAGRGGAVAAEERRVDLRHARRADPAAAVGRHHAEGQTASTSTCSTGRTRCCRSGAPPGREERVALRPWRAGAVHAREGRAAAAARPQVDGPARHDRRARDGELERESKPSPRSTGSHTFGDVRKDVVITVRVRLTLRPPGGLRTLARKEGRSLSQQIGRLIERGLDEVETSAALPVGEQAYCRFPGERAGSGIRRLPIGAEVLVSVAAAEGCRSGLGLRGARCPRALAACARAEGGCPSQPGLARPPRRVRWRHAERPGHSRARSDSGPALQRGRAAARGGGGEGPPRGGGSLLEADPRVGRHLHGRRGAPLQLRHGRVGDEVGPGPEGPRASTTSPGADRIVDLRRGAGHEKVKGHTLIRHGATPRG